MEKKISKRKLNLKRLVITFIVLGIIIFGIIVLLKSVTTNKIITPKEVLMNDLKGKEITEVETYALDNKLTLKINYEYDDEVEINRVISQSIDIGTKLINDMELSVVVSLGKLDLNKLKTDGINELGRIPVMMYHGIVDIKSSETTFTGGNVDIDGYNRTKEAFRQDLDFYYHEGYEMIRLIDYINGDIATSYGKSPIVLTFDDGRPNNIRVTGLDSDGNIIIDPNSAVSILEEYKEKYPDFNITATFFVNDYLFEQPEYNEKILKWLVDHGYDIGNHIEGHSDLSKTSIEQTQKVISTVYQELDNIIPNQYVKIISLPFGKPTSTSHPNFPYILNGSYNGYTYETISTLKVGWEPDLSPYDKSFNKTNIKRCRAYDNNGLEFDISMVFKLLRDNRYVSDGNKDTIITSESNSSKVIETTRRVIYY